LWAAQGNLELKPDHWMAILPFAILGKAVCRRLYVRNDDTPVRAHWAELFLFLSSDGAEYGLTLAADD
jgi:hypothetical protein